MRGVYSEADDCRSVAESFVVLDEVHSQAPMKSVVGIDAAESMVHSVYSDGSVSRRLKDAGSSTDVVGILMNMWRPDNQELNSAEEIPHRQGVINDVDVDDVLFTVEDDLKKLLTLIAYNKTGFVAKTAAMDAFTWFCGLDVVLENPYTLHSMTVIDDCHCRVFCKDDICKWVMGICSNVDATTQSTGLRGVRNMMKKAAYRRLLLNYPNFLKIVDFIKDGAPSVKHADVYVFEIYHILMNAEKDVPGEDLFMERLMERMESGDLTVEAAGQGFQCLETCIRLFENREALMERVLSNGSMIAWLSLNQEAIMAECLSLFFVLLDHLDEDKTRQLIHTVVNTSTTLETFFGHLYFGHSHVETDILQLMAKTVEYLPNAFYDDHLDIIWGKLQIVLEQGTEVNKKAVLDILHKLSLVQGFVKKNIPLPLPEDGLPFLALILNELNDQSIDILHFLWTHYLNVLSSLSKMQLVSTLLDFLTSKGMNLSADAVNKIHLFLVTIAEEHEFPSNDFDNCLIDFLRSNMSAEQQQIRRCLPIGLAIMKKLCKRDNDNRLLEWAMDQGFDAFLMDVMQTPRCLDALDDPTDLFHLLVSAIGFKGPDAEENDALRSKLFILTLNAATLFGVDRIVEVLTDFKNLDMATISVELTGGINEAVSMNGLVALKQLLERYNPEDSAMFLVSLLRVLLFCVQSIDIGTLGASDVMHAFVALLVRMPTTETSVETTKAMLSILAAIENTAGTLFADMIGYNPAAMEKIWDLLIENYSNNYVPVEDIQAILTLLKTTSTMQKQGGAEAHLGRLLNENNDLKAKIETREARIEELQSIQFSLMGQMQEQTDRMHIQDGSSSNTVENQAPDVSALETQVKRMKLFIGEKTSTIATLEERNDHLSAMLRDRDLAFKTMQDVVDSQHERMVDLENVLSSQGITFDF